MVIFSPTSPRYGVIFFVNSSALAVTDVVIWDIVATSHLSNIGFSVWNDLTVFPLLWDSRSVCLNTDGFSSEANFCAAVLAPLYDPAKVVLPIPPKDPDPTPTGPTVLIWLIAFSSATSISFPAICIPFAASRSAGTTISSRSASLINCFPDWFNALVAVCAKRLAIADHSCLNLGLLRPTLISLAITATSGAIDDPPAWPKYLETSPVAIPFPLDWPISVLIDSGKNIVAFLNPLPTWYPGILFAIIALINGAYFFAMSVGITASPGDSIAGTTSPAPFGPGTETTPLANFLAPRPGIIIPGLFIEKFLAAPAAEL